jgi:mannitol-1-phosphate/altronate dehydrogenase
VFYEYESYRPPFKKEKISHMIKKGVLQSARIIINNNKGTSDRFIQQNIIKRLKNKTFKLNIEEIWLYEKGKVRKLTWQ